MKYFFATLIFWAFALAAAFLARKVWLEWLKTLSEAEGKRREE